MSVTAEFVRYLEDRDMARLDVDGVGDRPHRNRLLIQKYALFAKEFGLRLPHKFNVYTGGPYSESLADEYHGLQKNQKEYAKARGVLNGKFDRDGFHKAVDGRRYKWLEVAATLIDRSKEERTTHKDLVDRICNSRRASKKYISGVLSELEEMKLVKLDP